MHYHLEIIMPPTSDIESAIEQIMKPFSENERDEDGDYNKHAFWDFYVIGGRWAGEKQICTFDKDKMDAFYKDLKEAEITVSGFTAGKQEIAPTSQIPMVDEMWRKHFPEGGAICPLFKHYNDQYKNSDGWPDIMSVGQTPKNLTASHVIIAGESYMDDGTLEAKTMISDSFWNGVSHVDSKWDGLVTSVIEKHNDGLKNAKDEYKVKHIVKDDWVCVTIDYHN